MKRWLFIAAIIFLAIISFYFFTRPKPVSVTLIDVQRGLVERTVSNTRAGTVEACQRSQMSLPIGGQITALNVKEGDRVEAGQLLVSLWNSDRRAILLEAKANLLSTEKEQESICAGARSDNREAKRLERLVAQQLVSKDVADIAHSKAEATTASCEAAKARKQQAIAAIATTEASLEQTHLYAPFAGIIAEVNGDIGEYSTPSPPGVATLPAIDLLTDDCHYVSAPIDEVDASDIQVGLPVKISLDAFRDQIFHGTVRRIAPYVLDLEKQARTVEVEADFVEGDEGINSIKLLAGYSADMEIVLEAKDNVLRIPAEVVIEDKYVMVVNVDSKLERKEIEKGIANWNFIEILSGLNAGDKIVSSVGQTGVIAGAKVDVLDGARDD